MDYQEDIYSLQGRSSKAKSTKGSSKIVSKLQSTDGSSKKTSKITEGSQKKRVPSTCLFMRTAFMTSMLNINDGQIGGYEYSRVSRWTEDVDIFFYD